MKPRAVISQITHCVLVSKITKQFVTYSVCKNSFTPIASFAIVQTMKNSLIALLILSPSFAFANPTVKLPCGLSGTTEERIVDCAKQDSSTVGSFVLVTRANDSMEVYKNSKSGLIWSDRVSKQMTFDQALGACKAGLAEMGGVVGDWRLPTREEFDIAFIDGITKEDLPNWDSWSWWTSRTESKFPGYGWQFFAFDGSTGGVNIKTAEGAVRCVTR